MTKSKRKRLRQILITVIVLFLAIQFIRPNIDSPPATGDFTVPTEVKSIIERACYDCHSNATNLRWYDQISPVYWKIAEHVKPGEKSLIFQTGTV
jgi:Haem-binding domain